MKSIFRFLGLGALAVTFTAAGATNGYAQDACADVEAKQALYAKFTINFDKTIELRKVALNAAKEYLEKYGSCPDDKQQVDYFKTYIPAAEKQIQDAAKAADDQAMYARFNNALKAKNWDEVYAGGKEVLGKVQDPTIQLDVSILLGSIGLDEAVKNNDKYNADTVRYAQEAIQKIESGVTSTNYGVANQGSGIMFKNAKFPDGKNNALGWLNYTIGYIKYNREKNKKDGLPYLYKATQYNSATKNFPEIYATIGQSYLDEIARLETDRTEKLKAANNVDTDETKAIYALQKGYGERASDAFARAYKLIGATPAEKGLKDNVYSRLKLAYEIRNGKADGLDAFISSVNTKPMPNPTTEVTPVVEVVPSTTTTSSDTSSAPAPAAIPVNNAKPEKAAKAASTTAKASAAETKTAKAPVKKVAPKKKGTR